MLNQDCIFQKDVRQKQKRHAYNQHHVSLSRLIGVFCALINSQQADETNRVKHHRDHSVRYELVSKGGIQKDESFTRVICGKRMGYKSV